jgi:histidinol-phosphate phosphatase family protein
MKWFGTARSSDMDFEPPPPVVDERPAVFVDKDGTLVADIPNNVDPSLLRFTPNAFEGLRVLRDAGFALVVVTNQPGIAQERFTRHAFARLEAALVARLAEEGIALEGFHLCPHAPQARPGDACLCRKPAPGLLRQAAIAHRLHLPGSWMIGDVLDDVEAGHRAGCRSVLLDVGNEMAWRQSPLRVPEHRCADLLAAAQFIVAAAPRTEISAARSRRHPLASRMTRSPSATAWSVSP